MAPQTNDEDEQVSFPLAAPAAASVAAHNETEGRKRRADSGENEASASENSNGDAAVSVALPPPAKKSASAQKKTTAVPATLYCFGQNICGQIGLGEDVQRRKFPALVSGLETKKVIGIACGGMHTVVLEEDGTVWTFGVNDEQALGRTTPEEKDCHNPGRVENLPNNIVQVTAGDSHSAALTSDGEVYAWGCFKDKNGIYGLIVNDEGVTCRTKPELITSNVTEKIIKIASGSHHIVMLGEAGHVYSCGGTNDQGQLGRQEPTARRVTRSMANDENGDPPSERVFLLQPAKVEIARNLKISDLWTGEFCTFVSSTRTNTIHVFGLNNYSQLGVANLGDGTNDVLFKATNNTVFRGRVWKQIAGGQHHTLALDEKGKVYSIGRSTEGRLGLGDVNEVGVGELRLVETLSNHKCVQIAAGTSTSYAITEDGQLYAWGFGENFQLATGDDNDRNVPTLCHGCKKDGDMKGIAGGVVAASAGGQHVAIGVLPPPERRNGH